MRSPDENARRHPGRPWGHYAKRAAAGLANGCHRLWSRARRLCGVSDFGRFAERFLRKAFVHSPQLNFLRLLQRRGARLHDPGAAFWGFGLGVLLLEVVEIGLAGGAADRLQMEFDVLKQIV